MDATVTSTLASLPQPSSAPTPPSNTLGKDDFLKLLTTQLQSQDPLSPMDSNAFVAQLAQFSTVEQLQGVGDKLDSLLLAQATSNQLSTASLVGKGVRYHADHVVFDGSTPAQVQISLDDASDATSLAVSDASGRVVRTIDLGARPAGPFTATWDGLDASGNPLPPGSYGIAVGATRKDGTAVHPDVLAQGTVSAVSFASGAAQLVVGGQDLTMSQIAELVAPSP